MGEDYRQDNGTAGEPSVIRRPTSEHSEPNSKAPKVGAEQANPSDSRISATVHTAPNDWDLGLVKDLCSFFIQVLRHLVVVLQLLSQILKYYNCVTAKTRAYSRRN